MYVRLHELKRCPFCGELAEVYRIPEEFPMRGLWVVGCDGKDGSLCPGHIHKWSPVYATRELAVEKWNTRPPLAVADGGDGA